MGASLLATLTGFTFPEYFWIKGYVHYIDCFMSPSSLISELFKVYHLSFLFYDAKNFKNLSQLSYCKRWDLVGEDTLTDDHERIYGYKLRCVLNVNKVL